MTDRISFSRALDLKGQIKVKEKGITVPGINKLSSFFISACGYYLKNQLTSVTSIQINRNKQSINNNSQIQGIYDNRPIVSDTFTALQKNDEFKLEEIEINGTSTTSFVEGLIKYDYFY